MRFHLWTFLFQVINFLVLVYILRRLLYRPLREAIDGRRETNARVQAEAEAARREAEALQKKLEGQLAELDGRREAEIKAARDRAESERQAMIAEAEAAIARRREEVDQRLAHEREEALGSIRTELLGAAVEAARRVLREAADVAIDRKLADRLVAELAQIPDDERLRLRGEWGEREEAVVETATEMNGEVAGEFGRAIESLAGRPMDVAIRVRPDLLGGVRIRIGGHVWDASLSGPLGELIVPVNGCPRVGGTTP